MRIQVVWSVRILRRTICTQVWNKSEGRKKAGWMFSPFDTPVGVEHVSYEDQLQVHRLRDGQDDPHGSENPQLLRQGDAKDRTPKGRGKQTKLMLFGLKGSYSRRLGKQNSPASSNGWRGATQISLLKADHRLNYSRVH